MEEQKYCICLRECFTERVIAQSDRMSYEKAKEVQDYLDHLFPWDVRATIERVR